MQRNEEVLRFIYDNQGNLLSQESNQGIRKYGYDLFGRQEGIELEDGNRQVNCYDGEGLRYQKEEITGEGFQNRAKVIRYQFDQKRNLIGTEEERGDDKEATSSRIIRGVDVVALWQDSEDTKESRLYYYGNDEQGSIKYLLDERGEIENQYRYDAFGVILKERDEVYNPIKYTGQEYDKLSEQYYLRARFYNPVTGRFLQEDRYRGDGLNLYAYCRNNPVVYCDTSGYSSDLSKQYQKKSDGNESVEGAGSKVNPNEIRFSQSSVNGAEEITNSMRANGWKGDPIDVVRMPDGQLTAIDNTRVAAARQAGIDVQANIHGYNDPLPSNFIDRFTTKSGVPSTWGEALNLRIGNQNATFRNTYPSGSFDMPKVNK